MTTLTTQSTKTTALTLAEADANFLKVAQAKTANYTCVEGDNRDTIECTNSITITLPVATTIAAAADTGDYEVTIKNVGTGKITVALQSTDTFDSSSAQNDYLTADQSKTYKVNQAGDGYNIVSKTGVYQETASVTTGTAVTVATTVPFDAKKITIDINSLEFSNAASPYIELGNASAWLGAGSYVSTVLSVTTGLGSDATLGILIARPLSLSLTEKHTGHMTLTKEPGSDIWNATCIIREEGTVVTYISGGRVDVTAQLTRIRVRSGGFDGSGKVSVTIE